MTYQEFKDFLVTFLWREGDQVLIDNLDTLILMAHASLRVDLRLVDKHISDSRVVETDVQDYPTNMRYIRQITSDVHGELKYVNPGSLQALRDKHSDKVMPYYSLFDQKIQLAGPFADMFAAGDLYTLNIFGYTDIPNFAAPGVDSSWMEENYLDTYVYAVLQHASAFLREDERINQWRAYYTDGVNRIKDSDAMFGQRGVQATLPLPYPASPPVHRNWRHDL